MDYVHVFLLSCCSLVGNVDIESRYKDRDWAPLQLHFECHGIPRETGKKRPWGPFLAYVLTGTMLVLIPVVPHGVVVYLRSC